jgi:hypothetical protein
MKSDIMDDATKFALKMGLVSAALVAGDFAVEGKLNPEVVRYAALLPPVSYATHKCIYRNSKQ